MAVTAGTSDLNPDKTYTQYYEQCYDSFYCKISTVLDLTMSKLKMWNPHTSWEDSELTWEQQKKEAATKRPLKTPKSLPRMVGITPDTAKNLKWKAFKYMVTEDQEGMVFKNFIKHPWKYGKAFFCSLWQKKGYQRDDDFFLYNTDSVAQFKTILSNPNSVLVVGFSYCHKPFECPSGRFTDQCAHDIESPICQQCFIGKCVHALPEERVIPLFITTIHYIGRHIFDAVHSFPGQEILFMITACELTLEMFADWGNMVNIKGIGVRLDGRICNTMKAFELSEKGIKPGLTAVLNHTQKRMLDIIRARRDS